MYLNGIETISSVTPLLAMTVFRSSRNFTKSIRSNEINGGAWGTKQYINSMRAQTHEFMNKLHVISGLIDLKKYEEVTHFIQQLNQNYKKRLAKSQV